MTFNSVVDIEKNLYDFKIIFAYNSNKLEFNDISFHDTRDIFENGTVTGYTGNLRNLFAIENQKISYEYLKDYIVAKKPLDLDFIKKIHYKLTRGTYDEYRYNVNMERPGEFKKHDYVTGRHEVGSYPENVEIDLQELIDEINSYDGNDHYTVGLYFHATFENIHPFADGNGRVGRTLMNYYFMTHGIAPVIIYNDDKNDYYDALEAYDTKGTLEPLKIFVENQQQKTWQKSEKRMKISLNDILSEDDENELDL